MYLLIFQTFLLGILIFKGLSAPHLYKSFGVKGLKNVLRMSVIPFTAISIRSYTPLHRSLLGLEATTEFIPYVKQLQLSICTTRNI
jgi:hypothetical protein